MNEDQQKELREQMEIRIVALLLGEASAFETAEIEQAIQKDAELAAFHDQMRRTIGLTREAFPQFSVGSPTAVEPPKLSPERRAALLAHFQRGKVAAAPAVLPKRARRRWLLPTSLAAGFVLFASVILSLNSRRFYRAARVTPLPGGGVQSFAAARGDGEMERESSPVQSFPLLSKKPADSTKTVVAGGDSTKIIVERSGAAYAVDSGRSDFAAVAPVQPKPVAPAKPAPKVFLPQSQRTPEAATPAIETELVAKLSPAGQVLVGGSMTPLNELGFDAPGDHGGPAVAVDYYNDSTFANAGQIAKAGGKSYSGKGIKNNEQRNEPARVLSGDQNVSGGVTVPVQTWAAADGLKHGGGGFGGGIPGAGRAGLAVNQKSEWADHNGDGLQGSAPAANDSGLGRYAYSVVPPSKPAEQNAQRSLALGDQPVAGQWFKNLSDDGAVTAVNGIELVRESGGVQSTNVTVNFSETHGAAVSGTLNYGLAPSGNGRGPAPLSEDNRITSGLQPADGTVKLGSVPQLALPAAPPAASSPAPDGRWIANDSFGVVVNGSAPAPQTRSAFTIPMNQAIPREPDDSTIRSKDLATFYRGEGEKESLEVNGDSVERRAKDDIGGLRNLETAGGIGAKRKLTGKVEDALSLDYDTGRSAATKESKSLGLEKAQSAESLQLEDKSSSVNAGYAQIPPASDPQASTPLLAARPVVINEIMANPVPKEEFQKKRDSKMDPAGNRLVADDEKVMIPSLQASQKQVLIEARVLEPTTPPANTSINDLIINEDAGIQIAPEPVLRAESADALKLGKRPYFQTKRDLESDQKKAGARKAAPSIPPTPQPEINTRENRFSTFSLNVSDVSFKLAAASLENSVMPDPASIRVEEFLNAFNYHDPAPQAGARLAFAWERARYPFAHNRDILRFSIQTAARGREPQKPLNLVILLDNSGSMERADRVQIVREAMKVLANQLQPQDRISVVAFARTARLCVDGMAGGKPKDFLEKVLDLNPDGGTNLEDALGLAYATAAKHFQATGMNRVILLTDGAANLGSVEPEVLKRKVVVQRLKGIALDCFGIGWEGYNDDLLEVLSHNGDGRYGFLDRPEEAAPEFANQLAGALNVAAADVKTQVEFNPRRVTTYRQIGYAKHQLTKEQFRDNKVDAAEIAASESGNALYVIEVNPEGSGPIGVARVRYKIPATGEYVEQEWTLPYQPKVATLDQSSPALRLATTAAAFGEWLARSPFAGEVKPSALQTLLNGVCETYTPDSRPQRLSSMIRQAQAIGGK